MIAQEFAFRGNKAANKLRNFHENSDATWGYTENLAILTADGTSPTHAIRHALEIAAHNKRQEDLRADAARLAANPEYQAEIRAIREELDELRAW